MTRSQMRDLLRRRVQEKTADQWQDADLNSLLDIGLHRTQLVIKRVHPDFALNRAVSDLKGPATVNNDLYDFPPGFISEYLVEMLDTDGKYKKVGRINFRDSVDRLTGDTKYSRTGKWIRISPAPTADLAAGLRIWFVPTLTMASDNDVPDIPIVLHEGPIIWANRLAIGERGQTSKDLQQDWIEFTALVLESYNVTDADPQYLSIDLDKTVF